MTKRRLQQQQHGHATDDSGQVRDSRARAQACNKFIHGEGLERGRRVENDNDGAP